MAKTVKKTVAAAKPAKKAAPAKVTKKAAPVAAKKSAPAPVANKAAWGEKSNILKALFTRKNGASAADIKAETGWKSVSAKALADRFAATWGNADGVTYKVVAVNRGEGEPVAYRWQ